jgi:cytochrome c-type biogenesis protein CcmE
MVLAAFTDNMMYFLSPSDLLSKHRSNNLQTVRLDGLVQKGSVGRDKLLFVVTDQVQKINVEYTGFIPSLFREGKGAVVIGQWVAQNNLLKATKILAQHDENYTPPGARMIELGLYSFISTLTSTGRPMSAPGVTNGAYCL